MPTQRRDRSSAPDTGVPYRPLYHYPLRVNAVDSFFDPRGIAMYWRSELRKNGTVVNAFPAWSAASTGSLGLNGSVAFPTETYLLTFELAGRVMPFNLYYGIQTRNNSTGGVIATTYQSMVVTGPGSYSTTWSGATNVNARLLTSGNQRQDNFPTD